MPKLKKPNAPKQTAKTTHGGARPNTGGAREGAGAKPKRGETLEPLSTRVKKSTKEKLSEAAKQAGKSLSDYVGEHLDGLFSPPTPPENKPE